MESARTMVALIGAMGSAGNRPYQSFRGMLRSSF
jgi:hypothetical protein